MKCWRKWTAVLVKWLFIVDLAHNNRFNHLCCSIVKNTKLRADSLKVPFFGESQYLGDTHNDDLFASNLTYMFNGFSNVQHTDRDESEHTFGMWFPVHKKGVFLFTVKLLFAILNSMSARLDFTLVRHQDGFSVSGGDFVWGKYGVGARMYKCDRVSMLFWKGKTDLHGTTIARQDGSFTILGTSMQISRYLTQKVTRYYKSSDMQGSIGDADELNC